MVITAHTDVVKIRPGLYQLQTVLNDMCKHRRYYRKYKERAKTHRYITKLDRVQIVNEYLARLPDDETELWNRGEVW